MKTFQEESFVKFGENSGYVKGSMEMSINEAKVSCSSSSQSLLNIQNLDNAVSGFLKRQCYTQRNNNQYINYTIRNTNYN